MLLFPELRMTRFLATWGDLAPCEASVLSERLPPAKWAGHFPANIIFLDLILWPYLPSTIGGGIFEWEKSENKIDWSESSILQIIPFVLDKKTEF